jgi:hypothetical protein
LSINTAVERGVAIASGKVGTDLRDLRGFGSDDLLPLFIYVVVQSIGGESTHALTHTAGAGHALGGGVEAHTHTPPAPPSILSTLSSNPTHPLVIEP